jgi:hypothetical protein
MSLLHRDMFAFGAAIVAPAPAHTECGTDFEEIVAERERFKRWLAQAADVNRCSTSGPRLPHPTHSFSPTTNSAASHRARDHG